MPVGSPTTDFQKEFPSRLQVLVDGRSQYSPDRITVAVIDLIKAVDIEK